MLPTRHAAAPPGRAGPSIRYRPRVENGQHPGSAGRLRGGGGARGRMWAAGRQYDGHGGYGGHGAVCGDARPGRARDRDGRRHPGRACRRRPGRRRLQGRALRRPAGRRPALETAAAGRRLGGRSGRHCARPDLHADRTGLGARADGRRGRPAERGLPLSQRLGAQGGRRAAARDGLGSWRRLLQRRGVAPDPRRRPPRGARRRGGHPQLPAQRLRFLRASSPVRRIAARRSGQLRPAGRGGRARMGARQRRRVRRRPAAGHPLRGVGRRRRGDVDAAGSAGGGSVPPATC